VREYGISTERIGILPFGADDGRIDISLRDEIRYETRESLGIAHDEFVFVFGGKIDARKNAIQLLKAFSRMNSEHSSLRVRLVIFGEPVPSMAHEFSQAICQPKVTHVTWTAATELYRLFWASDFAVFPGTHSVLWEEAAGLGVPMAVRRWKGITHLDVGGNCIFLERADESELVSLMYHIASDRENFEQMRVAATTIGVANFAYSRIAARSISEESEHDG
jgi:glycosyltransferase involved in cell wall biosynthesis